MYIRKFDSTTNSTSAAQHRFPVCHRRGAHVSLRSAVAQVEFAKIQGFGGISSTLAWGST
eukprot:SAG22_NODE_518_length_9512_cov_5.735897_7_plen_60_part_00